MYKVIAKFRDKDGTIYEVGEEYKGSKAKARLSELTTDKNKYGYPFIEEVQIEDEVPDDEIEVVDDDDKDKDKG